MESFSLHSGIPALDEVVQGLRLGDNVVWQVDSLDDYRYFAQPFADEGLAEGRRVVYLRFAPHPPVLAPRPGLEVVEVDPGQGFDAFSRAVHDLIEARGRGVWYVFDSLSALAEEWATDELLANLFQVTCPFLFELDTITYFALTRGHHAHSAVARIRDTTQLLVDVYHVKGRMYLHPLKVWDRYSPQMFLPHRVSGERWTPVFQSADAAEVAASARKSPLEVSGDSIAPWESVYRRLAPYREVAPEELAANPELSALKQELGRMLIGNQPQIAELADRYFRLADLLAIRDRMVGSGRIGGKAAGMLLARRILEEPQGAGPDFSALLEEHDSFYLGSDVFFTFLVHNNLFRLRLQLTRASSISREEFEEVETRFLAGGFPARIMDQFAGLLDYFGQAPIIVRSSSLLEDSIGNAFAGKYRSEFCANQGNPEQRMEAFLRAVKLVYASAINPDALSYRRRRGLAESDEQMAILVQRVSGMPHGRLFFPALAGVGFSRNLYAWNERIDPAQGMIRLVLGLGTRAVDRTGGDYPRMIAVSNPALRPEVGLEIVKYSQHQADVLDLQANALVTMPVEEIFAGDHHLHLRFLVSVLHDGEVRDPQSGFVEGKPEDWVVTCNNLIRRTDFVRLMGEMLARLEAAYGRPVDTEFTASVAKDGRVRINLLQCRPLIVPGSMEPVPVPTAPERTLFRAAKMIRGGVVRDLRYVVYVDPQAYAALRDQDLKRALGRVVGRINEHPAVEAGGLLLMGPGRWGSNNLELGVNVGYADIDNAAVLVEIARESAGQMPELSFGTHFFQDLVESETVFLAVYPDDPAATFNAPFFAASPNALTELLPDHDRYADYVKVIDVPSVTGGAQVQVVADAQEQRAICFLE
jgi:hypothetical protein